MSDEFKEIAHSGGKVSFDILHVDGSGVEFNIGYITDRPVPSKIVGIYALPEGIPVGNWDLGGLGQPYHTHSPSPISNCYPVFVVSDSEGYFGHKCPQCNSYWRSGTNPNCCPYCGIRLEAYQFLSDAQRDFISHYCKVLTGAIEKRVKRKVVIDMDAVADAVGEREKPSFYISEVSQQNKFICHACNQFNDIIGRYGYCSVCSARCDIVDFETTEIPRIKNRLNDGDIPSDCLRDAVSAFDSYINQGAKQLLQHVPMTNRRRDKLSKRFHNIEATRQNFYNWFDIDIFKGLNQQEQRLVIIMFHRRHLYEHNGGEVDQHYLELTKDTTVKLKQQIRENLSDVHDTLGSILKMAKNFHSGFHELLPPIYLPVDQ